VLWEGLVWNILTEVRLSCKLIRDKLVKTGTARTSL
jgi:hypothetical protein